MEIPGYKIKGELGRGGMSRVYLAIQENFDREVALKVMLPELLADATFSERFLREAKIVGQLSHPHIVAVFDVGVHENHHYISMSYHDDGDLKDKVQQGISPQQTLSVVQQIASALDFAHGQGFVHRDIKPENVLFRKDGTVVLSDFGISKAMDSNTSLTSTGTAIGTPRYMSPEQAGGKSVDGRADLYSLGVMLFEMLTGKVPYDAEDSIAIAVMHVTEPVPDLPEHLSFYQPLLNMMMAKDPDKRFQTGNEIVQDIQVYLNSQATSVSGPTGTVMVNTTPSLSQQTMAASISQTNMAASISQANMATSISQQNAAASVSQETVIASVSKETMAHTGQQPTDQKKSMGAGVILMLLAFIAAAGGGGFYYYNENLKKAEAEKIAAAAKKESVKPKPAAPVKAKPVVTPKPVKESLIVINSSPENANIYVNNRYQGITPVRLPDLEGKVSVKIIKDGYKDWTKKLDMKKGQTENIFAELVRRKVAVVKPKPRPVKTVKKPEPVKPVVKQKPVIPSYAIFVVLDPVDAQVSILNSNKKFHNGMRLDKGEYQLAVSKKGYKPVKRAVNIVKDMQLSFALEKIIVKNKVVLPKNVIQDKLKVAGMGPQMVIVPAGSYKFGSPKREYKRSRYESLPVDIVVPTEFAIGRYEITYDDFDKYTQSAGISDMGDSKGYGRGTHPANSVTWVMAVAYAQWLSEQTGHQYRLPTEQEWEYAARAGSVGAFSSGDCLEVTDANYNGGRGYSKCAATGMYPGMTKEVGSYSPNAWGLYDMHGNVWEWTSSCFSKKPDKTLLGSLNNAGKKCRTWVMRGGAFNSGARAIRVANRYRFPPNKRSTSTGFRLVREMP